MLLAVAFLTALLGGSANANEARSLLRDATCLKIESSISNASEVFWPGDPTYVKDISHFAASSTQQSKCSVEPGTPQDVSIIMNILSNSSIPFAVKGGGHATNPGFSSTIGVHIAMYRFNQVTYHADSSTADIGTGLVWDDVYAALETYGVSVAGGRVSGVGVAGFTLGGGYSWLTNLHGLTVDTVTAFEIVLPSGQVVEVTNDSAPDLFFGLKGGQNNFGIVTKITLRTFTQPQVWGGSIDYAITEWPAVTNLVRNFSASNADPNANILPTYDVLLEAGQLLSVIFFYNAPTPSAESMALFQPFLDLPALTTDVKTRSYLNLVQSTPSNSTQGLRGAFATVSLQNLSENVLNAIINQTEMWAASSLLALGLFVSYDVEPFMQSAYSAATPSAWPHNQFLSPLNLYFAWPSTLSDAVLMKAIETSAEYLRQVAIDEGQQIQNLPIYTNYALGDATLQQVFGGNVARLQQIKKTYDPTNVMGRAGGFKF